MASRMLTEYALWYFGGVCHLARDLGLSQPAVSQWGMYVPVMRQAQIEALIAEDAI